MHSDQKKISQAHAELEIEAARLPAMEMQSVNSAFGADSLITRMNMFDKDSILSFALPQTVGLGLGGRSAASQRVCRYRH